LFFACAAARRKEYGAESLRYPLLAGSVFYVGAALLYAFAARRVARDWVA
jgi:hypothetical protein